MNTANSARRPRRRNTNNTRNIHQTTTRQAAEAPPPPQTVQTRETANTASQGPSFSTVVTTAQIHSIPEHLQSQPQVTQPPQPQRQPNQRRENRRSDNLQVTAPIQASSTADRRPNTHQQQQQQQQTVAAAGHNPTAQERAVSERLRSMRQQAQMLRHEPVTAEANSPAAVTAEQAGGETAQVVVQQQQQQQPQTESTQPVPAISSIQTTANPPQQRTWDGSASSFIGMFIAMLKAMFPNQTFHGLLDAFVEGFNAFYANPGPDSLSTAFNTFVGRMMGFVI